MRIIFTATLLTVMLGTLPALANDPAMPTLTIENHRFIPDTIDVPAGVKFKLEIINKDATPEEFESHDLNREKIIPGNSKGRVFIGPLKPGTYAFFGEFNQETAQGKMIAK